MFKHLSNAFAVVFFSLSFIGTASGVEGPAEADALVRQVSIDVIHTAKTDKGIQEGDTRAIQSLVETKVMPHVDFETITRSAVGPKWRDATPEQRTRLQGEFEKMLIRVYSGALSQARDQTVAIVKTAPSGDGTQNLVQTEVRGKGEPIKLDYRLERPLGRPDWKITDVGIGGLWLVQNYRTQFAHVLAKGGLDGLLATLVDRNKLSTKK